MTEYSLPGRETIGSFAATCLAENGVDTVFGIPGTHNIEIYRGLQRRNIRHILTRHEQGATYAADGYARASGQPGVVIATSGPGITNCITGIANAYADSVPLLVLSPGPRRGEERRNLGFLHEAKDQRSGIDCFAEESIRAESQRSLEEAIHGAFLRFRTGRPRPIHIEIPTDLLEEESTGAPEAAWNAGIPSPDSAAITAVAAAIRTAERPLILVGGGSANYGDILSSLVDLTGIPVVTTVQGKGTVSERHPRSVGALAGGSSGFQSLQRADFVLAFGTELKNAGLGADVRVARFDIDAGQLHKNHRSDFPVLGDVGLSAAALLAELANSPPTMSATWLREVLRDGKSTRAGAQEVWAVLHDAVTNAARGTSEKPVILTGDSSQISWQGTVQSAVLERPRSFLTTDGYATLGYGLPAAIGAKLARPEASVVSLLGDGALMFSVQELATAAEQRLALPIVVFDNGGYAEIEQNMRDAGVAPFAVALTPPKYAALATALNCRFSATETPAGLEKAVREALTADRPTLIRIAAEDFNTPVWRH